VSDLFGRDDIISPLILTQEEDMSYVDLRDFAPEYLLVVSDFETQENVYKIQLEKLGGGRYGVAYRGNWRAIVTKNGEEILRSQDFVTNTPTTHHDVACDLIEYLTDDIGAYDCAFPLESAYMDSDGNWVSLLKD
jgi:hypothetical protein